MAQPFTTKQKVAGGAVGIGAGAMALAAVFIPHWESGGRMDTTVRQQGIDRAGVYTVCDGITNLDPDYGWIRPGMKFTEAQCAEAFKKVLPKYIEPIAKCIPSYYAMPPHRQVALLSFSFNLGPGRICNGTIAREFNAGHTAAACNAMGQYIKANGKVLRGLQNRRFDPKWGEITWCMRED
jgi:lysozyme